MSLSDKDEFKPMALSSLEQFDQERSNKTDALEPDFNRFELLFERPVFPDKDSNGFKAMYDTGKKQESVVFKPLIKEKPVAKDRTSPGAAPEEVMETAEDREYQIEFTKGYEQGKKEGEQKGFEHGFKKGEAEGLKTGENQGFEKGESLGFDQGLKEGNQKAADETRKKSDEIVNSLEASLTKADQTLAQLVKTYEEKMVSLIQQIAEKAVLAEVEVNDEIVKSLILDALKTLVQPEEIVLSVSMEDYEYIEMIKDEFFEQIDSLNSISVRSDPSIKRGGCRIDTNTASVSTDPESRLDAIFNAMKSAGAK